MVTGQAANARSKVTQLATALHGYRPSRDRSGLWTQTGKKSCWQDWRRSNWWRRRWLGATWRDATTARSEAVKTSGVFSSA